jgi:hypothetical protein
MKKRVGFFLFSLALAAYALVPGSSPAEGVRCVKPDCFASPGCCKAQECAEWCATFGGGGAPGCDGNGLGGCCYCGPAEG